MITMFALFDSIADAGTAVNELLKIGFDEQSINTIVQETVAKNYLDINRQKIKIEKSDAFGGTKVHGLQKLLGGKQSIPISDTGKVLVSGEIATTISKAASMQNNDNSFVSALTDFSVPAENAQKYTNGLLKGGLIFFIRFDENRSGDVVATISKSNARDLTSIR